MSRVVEIPEAARRFELNQTIRRKSEPEGSPLWLVVLVDRGKRELGVLPASDPNGAYGDRKRFPMSAFEQARYFTVHTRAEMGALHANRIAKAKGSSAEEAIEWLMTKQREALGCATDAEVDALPTVEPAP